MNDNPKEDSMTTYKCLNCGKAMDEAEYAENCTAGTHTDANGKTNQPNNGVGYCPNSECSDFTLVPVA